MKELLSQSKNANDITMNNEYNDFIDVDVELDSNQPSSDFGMILK